MRELRQELLSAAPGHGLALTGFAFGPQGGRKVYLQGGLHADEMPGPLVLHHLKALLAMAEAEGRLKAEFLVVPYANPIGLTQWVAGKPQGRQDLESGQNFNRGFPALEKIAEVPVLAEDAAANLAPLRAAFGAALRGLPAATPGAALRRALMLWSHDADYVLDLHCDHWAIPHLYTTPLHVTTTDHLAQAMGAGLVLLEVVSGGNAFDEAHSAPFHHLREAHGAKVPDGPFACTLEYRGQFDVADVQAAADAAGLMRFFGAEGLVLGEAALPPAAPVPKRPLSGALEVFAPQGGIVTWDLAPGAEVTRARVMGHVTDPASGRRLPVIAPCDGLLFRQELWRACLAGQGLAHVAGEVPMRSGDLLSD